MSALNGLHDMLETESLQKEFLDFQLEQMVNRDIRDLNLAMEGEDVDLPDDDEMDDKKDAEEGCSKECGDADCGMMDDDDDDDFDGYDEDSDYGDSDMTGSMSPSDDDDFDELDETLDFDVESMDLDIESAGPEISNENLGQLESLLAAIPEATPAEVAKFHRTMECGGIDAINAALEEETCANLLIG